MKHKFVILFEYAGVNGYNQPARLHREVIIEAESPTAAMMQFRILYPASQWKDVIIESVKEQKLEGTW